MKAMTETKQLNLNNYIDGRSLRRTGRTKQFSTKVHPSFKNDLAEAALITGKKYNEILEESIRLYLENIEKI